MKNFDVNLLKVLEVLLQEKSVTAAACRLHRECPEFCVTV